uniref:Uncharacterized protein n=1 Tax=Sciurus vulgaris TaxID=55149 RepID=A0A8D2CT50_SCIVU
MFYILENSTDSSLGHLARTNPFNLPHLQLVHAGLSGPNGSFTGPLGPPQPPGNLAAAAVEAYSCKCGSVRFYALHGSGGALSCRLMCTAVPLLSVTCPDCPVCWGPKPTMCLVA